jgi:hypothetical protein
MNNIKNNDGVAESIFNFSDITKINQYFFKREDA